MPPASPGDQERRDREKHNLVAREVDSILKRGGSPDAAELAARFSEDPDRVKSIVALRQSLFDEGMLDDSDDEPAAAPEAPGAAADGGRDDALADIKAVFQDAMNRGARPDVTGLVDERPELKDEVAELSQFYNFISDALKPEFAGVGPEPVQEVVLSHFRLVAMHSRHPLGGLFLGVDQHTSRHVEMLVIRGQMSRSRSSRLLRDAIAMRDVADPGFVPVIDAGEVHDLKYVAWDYGTGLSFDRVIRRLRRGGGVRSLSQIIEEHEESSDSVREPAVPAEDVLPEVPGDSAARLISDPAHVAQILEIVATAAETLDRAHLRGLVLGDVRPANVFVAPEGKVRLRGFGLVPHARAAWHRLGTDVNHLAPEILDDHEPGIDWRADVWGVALLVYAGLALNDPPDFAAMDQRAERLFIDLRGAPEGLIPLLERALDPDPAERPASCGEIAQALRTMAATLRPPPPVVLPPRVPRWVWYAAVAVVAAGVAVWVLM